MNKSTEKGKRRSVWLSDKLDKKAEETRELLGLSHSRFYRFAVIELLKQFQTEQFTPRSLNSPLEEVNTN